VKYSQGTGDFQLIYKHSDLMGNDAYKRVEEMLDMMNRDFSGLFTWL